ncbi:MAG TPA: VTT domain-containing protein [Candidatus Paceibacterota bacterium]|nr:VTT domain-containing protein [Candidatus Paceibacterota bacterium]
MSAFFHLGSFSDLVPWLLVHGYWIMFVAMLIEGPVVTAAAAFAYAMGYFDLAAIFVLSLLGDIVADVIYYAIGYWGRMTVVEKYGHWVGLSHERLRRIGRLVDQHAGKTMLVLKLTPFIPTPGLMLIGATRMKLSKFTFISASITLPKTVIFMAAGFYFGVAYQTFSKTFGYISMGIIGVILLVVLYQSYQGLSNRIAARIEKL